MPSKLMQKGLFGPCQTSTMELFAKTINGLGIVKNIYAKKVALQKFDRILIHLWKIPERRQLFTNLSRLIILKANQG